jgi:hypothetical protein
LLANQASGEHDRGARRRHTRLQTGALHTEPTPNCKIRITAVLSLLDGCAPLCVNEAYRRWWCSFAAGR